MIVSRVIAILILSIAWYAGVSQSGLSIVYAPSKVIKHRDNLLFNVPDRSHEFRLSYTFQTDGKQSWQRYWKEPRLVLNAAFVNFGDREVLGEAYAILPEIHFTLAQWNKVKLNMQFGSGIAYLSRPYDAITNPENNAIGSNLNNTSSLKLGIEYQWSDRLYSNVSTGQVHFSNGLSSSPNSGINIYGLSFGLGYLLQVEEELISDDEILTRSSESTSYRKWIADVQYHYGFTEHATPGGPKFGVQALSIGAGYRYSEFMTVLLGGEYEYNEGAYIFHKLNFYTEEEAKIRAKKTIVYLENEFRYGSVFNRFRVGFYLGYPSENTKDYYMKVVSGVYLPSIKNYAKPYVGVVLKTHTAVADYLAVMAGVSF